jgi:Uri superfamily endonuclease
MELIIFFCCIVVDVRVNYGGRSHLVHGLYVFLGTVGGTQASRVGMRLCVNVMLLQDNFYLILLPSIQ